MGSGVFARVRRDGSGWKPMRHTRASAMAVASCSICQPAAANRQGSGQDRPCRVPRPAFSQQPRWRHVVQLTKPGPTPGITLGQQGRHV
jgi:hypothetical protein